MVRVNRGGSGLLRRPGVVNWGWTVPWNIYLHGRVPGLRTVVKVKMSARMSSRMVVIGLGAASRMMVRMMVATLVENWALWGLTMSPLSLWAVGHCGKFAATNRHL